MGKVISVTNQKGGVGKTTTNVNLSACVAASGKKVLTIDMDPQGNTTSALGLDKKKMEKSIYNVLIEDTPIKECICATDIDNLSIVPANIELAGAEVELVALMARENILKRHLETISGEFDFIFIDCPPSLGLLTLNALTGSDRVIIPIQCEYFALEGVGQLVSTVKLVNKRLNPRLEIEGVVLTMLDGRTNLGLQVVQEVKKHFRSKVYGTIIPRNVRLSEAPSHGKPIHIYDPKCLGAEAYKELAREFLEWNEEGY